MPLGELETHPYLEEGSVRGATKLILGSFPVYECTDPENNIKIRDRIRKNSVQFFYGSGTNKFWSLYKTHVDQRLQLPPAPDEILKSLDKHKIAISDTIYSCERHNKSSSDNKLIRKSYNIDGIHALIKNGITKIICTSKGVLKDLEKQIILQGNLPFGQVDNLAGSTFQDNFITGLGGNNNQITSPIAKVFIVDNFQVTALAIPSPGSPQRQLAQFGFNGEDWRNYADNYFSNAFNWLKE